MIIARTASRVRNQTDLNVVLSPHGQSLQKGHLWLNNAADTPCLCSSETPHPIGCGEVSLWYDRNHASYGPHEDDGMLIHETIRQKVLRVLWSNIECDVVWLLFVLPCLEEAVSEAPQDLASRSHFPDLWVNNRLEGNVKDTSLYQIGMFRKLWDFFESVLCVTVF